MYAVLTTDRMLHLLPSSLGTDLNKLSKSTSIELSSSLSSRFERQPKTIAELSLNLSNCTMQIEPKISPEIVGKDDTVRTFSVQQLPTDHHASRDSEHASVAHAMTSAVSVAAGRWSRVAQSTRTVLAAPTEEAMVEWMAAFKRLEDDSHMAQ